MVNKTLLLSLITLLKLHLSGCGTEVGNGYPFIGGNKEDKREASASEAPDIQNQNAKDDEEVADIVFGDSPAQGANPHYALGLLFNNCRSPLNNTALSDSFSLQTTTAEGTTSFDFSKDGSQNYAVAEDDSVEYIYQINNAANTVDIISLPEFSPAAEAFSCDAETLETPTVIVDLGSLVVKNSTITISTAAGDQLILSWDIHDDSGTLKLVRFSVSSSTDSLIFSNPEF